MVKFQRKRKKKKERKKKNEIQNEMKKEGSWKNEGKYVSPFLSGNFYTNHIVLICPLLTEDLTKVFKSETDDLAF